MNVSGFSSAVPSIRPQRLNGASSTPIKAVSTPPRAQPANGQTLLADAVGPRKLTLRRDTEGSVQVTLSPSPVTELVLSGGGVKGVAYPGVIQALEDKGVLKGVQRISGSSAGGISAALLASGMGEKAFTTLSNSLDLPKLLNSKDPLVSWLQDASSKVGALAGKVSSLSQRLFELLPRLGSKAEPLEDVIRDESRKSVLAHIADFPRDKRTAQVMAIADRLSAGGATTFRDLQVLSRHIPAIKELNITGTGMFAGRAQLVVFNASLTPDMDIARAAHISGALPIVFQAPKEQGHGFQIQGETTSFQDGGLMVNTPATSVYQRQFPASELTQDEQLILTFDEQRPPAVKGTFGGAVLDKIVGTPHSANNELMQTRLAALRDQTVIVPLNTQKGDFRGFLNGTVNFSMPADVKEHLQELSRKAVNTHLETRASTREHHRFDSMTGAVLAMDDQMLASVAPELGKDNSARDVLRFRTLARKELGALDTAIRSANGSNRLAMTAQLASVLRNLDALASRTEYDAWLSRELNDANNPNFQQLLQARHEKPSKVLSSAITEMKKRDIAVIADNFIREVLYPSLFRLGQPEANVALLRGAEQKLAQVGTRAEFNAVLDDIAKNYKARGKPWGRPFSSTTIKMAKAWRLPQEPRA